MKRVIALLLTIALLMGVCPVHIFASEDEFVGISIVLNGIEKQCRVIESGAELLFSGEDLAEFGGYTYRVDGENAYFTRGQKTVRVNVARNILIPFDGTDYSKSNKNITLNTSVREKDGVYYFPGTQLLPWLSVNCFAESGKLCIITDEISVWDLIAEFNPEDFAFDFAECCEDLGKSSKWVKAGAAFQGFGLETIFGWLPTFGNDSNEEHDYYDIFEEMLQEQTCSQTSVDEMMEDVDKINEWMDWAEAMKVKDELPDDWKAIGMVSDFIGSAPMGLSEELGLYLSSLYLTTIERDHQEKLNAIKYIVLSGGNFPDEMRAAAETIYLEYTDYVLGILGKGIDVLYEALKDLTFDLSYDAIEKVAGEYFKKVSGEFVADVYKIVLAVLDFPGMVEYDCAEGIRRVDCYSAIAAESGKEYQENRGIISEIGIQNSRCTAYLYLYAVGKNWRTMSDYALESGFLEYAAEYRAHADAAQEMASKFLQSSFSQVNDSPEYVAGEPRRKQGYTDKLKAMFSTLNRTVNEETRLSAIHAYSDEGGTLYSLEYDDQGRIKRMVESHYGEYFLDSEIDPIKSVYNYTYDDLGKLTQIDGDNGNLSTQFIYNEKGLLKKSIHTYFVSATTEYFYDESERLIAEEAHTDIEDTRIEYTYDEKGALEKVVVLWDQSVEDTYVSGQPISEDSQAAYYYRCMTEQEQYYGPLVISEIEERASIVDSIGNEIITLYLSNPRYVVDSMGNPVQISCDYETYEFFYADNVTDKSSSANYSEDFIKFDYGMLMGALSDAGLTDIQWELSEMEFDGTDELLVTATGGDWRASWESYPLLADVNQRLLWYYDPGPAGSAEWAFMNSAGKPVLKDSYSTAWSGVWHSEWTGSSWNVFAEYERSPEYNINGEYLTIEDCMWLGTTVSVDEYTQHINNAEINNMTLGCPDLSTIVITGDPDQIVAELEEYLSESGYLWGKEHQQPNRISYLIPGAANNWKTEPSNIAEELGQSNFDCALTLITAEISKESVSLVLSRTYVYG